MAIAFNTIPSNLRVPIVAVEFDASRAQQNPGLLAYRVLIIGQRRSGGTAAANTLHKVTSPDQVLTLAGRGSLLHRMALAYFANNRFTETYIGVLDDNGAGVAASGTLTVTGPATAPGTLNLYLGGVRVSVAIASGDAQNTIATAIRDAINANADLPVTATASTNVVTVSHRHKGEVGNGFDMRLNYQEGESTPSGVSVAIVQLANGTTNPSLSSLLAALGDTWFNIIAHPYVDSGSLSAIEAELLSRNGPTRMIEGIAITSAVGTQSALGTLGDSRNSQFTVIVAQPGKSPVTPASEFAAAVAAVAANYGAIDPARPFQTLPVLGVKPPATSDLFTIVERNLELFDGISTTRVGAGGQVQIDRLVTSYQRNAANAEDLAYLDVTTILTLMYLRYGIRSLFATKYPRHKLADDSARFGAGQAVITPKIAKAEIITWLRGLEEGGIVENVEEVKQDIVVERDASDPNRLNMLVTPNLMNQLVVGAVQIKFGL